LGDTSSRSLLLSNVFWLMQTCLSISVGEILHGDIQVLEVSWEDPSDTECDDGHSSPRPYEPWVSDDTGKSKGDSGRDGLIEEGERVDETLHSSWGSGVGKLVCGDIDE
jgi:hypothetical protein